MNTITSTVLGELTQSKDWDDYWESSFIEIPLFDHTKMKIILVDFEPEIDTDFMEKADSAWTYFIKKDANYRLKISHLAYKNCMDFLQAVDYNEEDKPLWDIKEEHEIWNFIYPERIDICQNYNEHGDMYVVVMCECDWERENGLQFVFKHGKRLTRVSSIDGLFSDDVAYTPKSRMENKLSITEKESTKKDQVIKKQSWWKKL
ncbi:MAG: hypothetical protein AAF611_21455 [Bacteroidota bacterium]